MVMSRCIFWDKKVYALGDLPFYNNMILNNKASVTNTETAINIAHCANPFQTKGFHNTVDSNLHSVNLLNRFCTLFIRIIK